MHDSHENKLNPTLGVKEEVEIFAFPASYQQQQLWFLNQYDPQSPVYNIPFAFHIKGELNLHALGRSINEIVNRHEIFRTVFSFREKYLTQIVKSSAPLKIPVVNLTDLPAKEKKKEAKRISWEEARGVFDLSKDPLLRISLIRLEDNEYVLNLIFHHIIADHTSVLLFGRELEYFYSCFLKGVEPSLSRPELQYADFSIWQRDEIQLEALKTKIEYWKKHLEGDLTPLELPSGKIRPPKVATKGEEAKFEIDNLLTAYIKEFGRKEKITLFNLLLASIKILLHRYTNKIDIILGCPFANRSHPGTENVFGCLMNTLPLKSRIDEETTFRALLKELKQKIGEAKANQEVSFDQIIESVKPPRDNSYNPLFQVSFVMHQAPFQLNLENTKTVNLSIHNSTSKFDLSIIVHEDEGRIKGSIEYNSEIYTPDWINIFIEHFRKILVELIKNPDAEVNKINFLSREEQNRLLYELNETGSIYKPDCLHRLFEKSALENPEDTAVWFKNIKTNYSELNEKANKTADYMLSRGVKPGNMIGIYFERSTEMLISVLAVLKTGCAYVPLDPSFPDDRIRFMMADAGLKYVITDSSISGKIVSPDINFLNIDKDSAEISGKSSINREITVDPDSIAYVIYTSGSTGKPKGVKISHKSVVNFLLSMKENPGIVKEDILYAVTTLSFDISILELFLPLISGASVVISPNEYLFNPEKIVASLNKHNATIMQATPATWKMLIESGWEGKSNMKILCGGEILTPDLAKKLLSRGGSLYNMYGPTETCIWSSLKRIDDPEAITIGRPINNTQMYILDESLNPVPAGVTGELYIGGDGLSAGYLNREELTDQKFVPNPFINNKKIYRTGDLARYTASGEIECLGRNDFQVKIRGFRIETGEIEAKLNELEKITDSLVAARKDHYGTSYLSAYIIGDSVNTDDIKKYLKQSLPDYMIPSEFVFLEKFPLTPNGKVDRNKLPQADQVEYGWNKNIIPPSTLTERKIVNIWEGVLQRSPIGVSDNFFDIGGHSILAAKLFALMSAEFGRQIPLSLLFQSPTIREIAEELDKGKVKKSWSSVVPIRVKGNRPPLFFIHGAGGNVLLYRDLAKHLGEDQPFYGIQSQGLDGSDKFPASFEEMAELYISEIREVQPKGPYFLGGYCLGGTLAFETARQLKQQNEEVGMVIMLETYNINHNLKALSFPYSLLHKFQNLKYHAENVLMLDAEGMAEFISEKAAESIRRMKDKFRMNISRAAKKIGFKEKVKFPHINIASMNDAAQERYLPKRYDGEVLLFRPKKEFKGFEDPHFGWKEYAAGGVKVKKLDVNPHGMLVEPFVVMLAKELRLEMDLIINNEVVQV